MAGKNDYYKLLEINKDASPEEVKKSYNRLAKKWHPDKNLDNKEEATEKFKQISEAYHILSDPEKREIYDNGGMDALKESEGGNPFEGFDPFNMFSQLSGVFGNMFGDNRNGGVEDVVVPIKCTLEELYTGVTKQQEITRLTLCTKCYGTGTKDKTSTKCKKCKGQGAQLAMIGPGRLMQIQCEECEGSGKDSNAKKCKECSGNTVIKETVTLEVVVPPGAHNKYPIRVEEEGHAIPIDLIKKVKKNRSDVICVVIEEDEQTHFKRGLMIPEKGKVDFSDLMIELSLTFMESLCGFYREIKHLDNHSIHICIKDAVRHGDTFVIKNEGMKVLKKNKFGDLIVKLNVQHPNELKLSISTKTKLSKLFYNSDNSDNSDNLTENATTIPVVIPTGINPAILVPFEKYKIDIKIQSQSDDMMEQYKQRGSKNNNIDSDDDSDNDNNNGGGRFVQQQCPVS